MRGVSNRVRGMSLRQLAGMAGTARERRNLLRAAIHHLQISVDRYELGLARADLADVERLEEEGA